MASRRLFVLLTVASNNGPCSSISDVKKEFKDSNRCCSFAGYLVESEHTHLPESAGAWQYGSAVSGTEVLGGVLFFAFLKSFRLVIVPC
jgi:hypothetical protein